MAEKNDGPRLLVAFERATGGERTQAVASEISLGGLFIETKSPMENGTLLTVEITSGNDSVTLEGRVFSTRATPEGTGRPAGMAVRFLDLPMAAVAKLTGMLERHRPPARTQIGTGAPPPPTPQDGVPALDVAIPQAAPLPAEAAAPAAPPAPEPRKAPKGTAIMVDAPGQAEAMAKVAAARAKLAGTMAMSNAPQRPPEAAVPPAHAAAPAPVPPPPMLMDPALASSADAFAPTPAAPEAYAPPPPQAPAPPMAPPPPMDPYAAAARGAPPPVSGFASPAPYPPAQPQQQWGQPMAPGAMMPAGPAKSNTTLIIVLALVGFFVLTGIATLVWALG